MKDCLGNEVINFVPNVIKQLQQKADFKLDQYLHNLLITSGKLAVRVYDSNMDTIGWNMVSR